MLKGLLPVLKKDVLIMFYSPIYYVCSLIFALLSGYFFYSNIAYFGILSLQASGDPFLSDILNLSDMVIKPFFGNIMVILLLLVPLLTMRSFAEEKKQGTIELLFTYPISDWGCLLGKFFAVVVSYLGMLIWTIPCIVILTFLGSPDWGIVLSAYLGIFLAGLAFSAFGIFASSITENQIVSAVIAFGGLLLLWAVGWMKRLGGDLLGKILEYISMTTHTESFAIGIIDTRDVLYFFIFSVFWLGITSRILQQRYIKR